MSQARNLSQQLARNAEAVCRHYLSGGYRAGDMWKAGDACNAKPKPQGGSLTVSLNGPYAGHWKDYNPAAPHNKGDLLDLIQHACGFTSLRDAMDEARRFLGSAQSAPLPHQQGQYQSGDNARKQSRSAFARQLFSRSKPMRGSQAEAYLTLRGITSAARYKALRAHSRLKYPINPDCPDPQAQTHYPAKVAAATDLDGNVVGIQRTFIELGMPVKAKVLEPRKSLGMIHGYAVWLGEPAETIVVGEGIETVLSVLEARPELTGAATLAADNMPAFVLPDIVRRVLIARDNDPGGRAAAQRLKEVVEPKGIDVIDLTPKEGDFNDDLRALGKNTLSTMLQDQIDRA